ncbi:hypothetical protein N7488_006879 [Penicillium malachiteum]|nr:hypothetical protein N7488_006879 [Penicillium malachiteum]
MNPTEPDGPPVLAVLIPLNTTCGMELTTSISFDNSNERRGQPLSPEKIQEFAKCFIADEVPLVSEIPHETISSEGHGSQLNRRDSFDSLLYLLFLSDLYSHSTYTYTYYPADSSGQGSNGTFISGASSLKSKKGWIMQAGVIYLFAIMIQKMMLLSGV